MDVYAETILDHYRHPRGKKSLQGPAVEHEEINHSCGDAITIQLKIEDGTVTDIGWEGTGCAISQASMSMLAEDRLIGKKDEDLLSLSQKDMYDMLGVPIGPRRMKCALLSLHTLKNALRKARGMEPQSWLETLDVSDK